MFARILKSNVKLNRVDEFNQTFDKQIIPMLRKAKGFQESWNVGARALGRAATKP